MRRGFQLLVSIALLGALLAPVAHADILLMKDATGHIFLTNRGPVTGYRVVTRYREFVGSSGLGLHSLNARDAAKYDVLVSDVASRFAIDPQLVKAVIRAESNFNPMATSPKGAMGLMQLMPDTARLHNVSDSFDPSENIDGGVRHLKLLLGRYQGDLELSLAAYNAGIKAVEKYGGIPPFVETQDYVRRVLRYYGAYRGSIVQTIRQVQR
jgi:soluble lytic murein transglycosylase-like protein